jgi:hypothetical protein
MQEHNVNKMPIRDRRVMEKLALQSVYAHSDDPDDCSATMEQSVAFVASFLREYRMGSYPLLKRIPRSGEISRVFNNYIHRIKSQAHQNSLSDSRKHKRASARSHSRRKQVTVVFFFLLVSSQ